MDFNPVAKVKAPKVDGRDQVILTDDQYEELLAAAGERDMLRLYILVLGETGMRSGSEALWLTWDDLDLRGGFLRVVSGRHDHRTKTGEGRWVPMTPRLREALREHAATYNAVRRAKLPAEFWQHDLRHRRVTTWLAEGKNPVHVKEAVGHSDLRTTMSYTHLSREHLPALVDPFLAPPTAAQGSGTDG